MIEDTELHNEDTSKAANPQKIVDISPSGNNILKAPLDPSSENGQIAIT